ncbi:MAG: hypothetical protein M1816_006010 [Peltula sp. TS41687]|nr:MAG: hypothetical protein M1816_006010 [Peltula sp. TS41687]
MAGRREHLLVILPWEEPKEQLERIRKNHPDIDVTYHRLEYGITYWRGATQLPPETFHSATIFATFNTLPPSPSDCPVMRLIHFFSAGIDHVVDHPIYRDSDITLTTSSGIHGPQIAEWVVGTALAHSHRFPLMLGWQREKRWGSLRELGMGRDMVGQRLGVLGYGAIGRQESAVSAARVAKAMGMDIIAYTATPRPTKDSKRDQGYIVPGTGDPDGSIPSAWYSGLEKSQLHEFLRQDIDILLVSVPLTTQTTHFLSKKELEILGKRRNAFISNISRGQVIKQDDLIEALKRKPEEGGLRGAALDVTDPEPLPKESELWTLPNVILTPHISGSAETYVERAFQVLETNLSRMEKGEGLINVVHRKRGY